MPDSNSRLRQCLVGAWVLGMTVSCSDAGSEMTFNDISVEQSEQALTSAALPSALRVFGQPDLKQTNYNQVVASRGFYVAGVLVDRAPDASTNSRVYLFDSGNSRILGFDSIGTCSGGSKAGQACTEDSFCGAGATCAISSTKNATFALGQPSTSNAGACNGDNTTSAAATASTLCFVPYPNQISPLEGPRGGQVVRDSARNVYTVDTFNNRVVKYNSPFATGADTVADWQFGQTNMTSRLCNQGLSAPTAQTLCTGAPQLPYQLFFTSAMDVSPDGQQVWIADPGNHRVLKVKPGTANAQLVLGQSNFTTAVDPCGAATSSSICDPTGIAYDSASNTLYVLDSEVLDQSGSGRILVFKNPGTNGQAATQIWNMPSGSALRWPRGLTLEPATGALWVNDTANNRTVRFVAGAVSHVIGDNDLAPYEGGCLNQSNSVCAPHGSIGIDRDGKFLVGDLDTQRVKKFPAASTVGGAEVPASGAMFDVPGHDNSYYANQVSASGLANPGYVAFVGTQMVVADRLRIVFWNNYASSTPFAAGNAGGVLAQTDFASQDGNTTNHWNNFTSLAYDATRKLMYTTTGDWVQIYNVTSGLVDKQLPAQEFSSGNLTTPAGVALNCNLGCSFTHLSVDAANDIGWLVDSTNHRVLRITSLSTSARKVDMVLGQSNLNDRTCNRGLGVWNVAANGFCDPAQTALDAQGNLFVVDGTWECREGNCRVVQYQKSDLPAPNGTLQAPSVNPVRVYGQSDLVTRSCDPSTGRLCSPRFVAFDPRDGSMVATGDAYYNALDKRIAVWTNPTKAGVTAPLPSSFYSSLRLNQAGNVAIDAAGNMAVLDHTWNRITLFATPQCNPATDDCASSAGSGPCSGLCSSPVKFTSQYYSSGNLGTNATCHETTAQLTGGNCGNMSSRVFKINNTTMTCNGANFAALPAKRNGGYCMQASAGTPSYAYFTTF